jgi:hypothetical protein
VSQHDYDSIAEQFERTIGIDDLAKFHSGPIRVAAAHSGMIVPAHR